MPQLEDGEEPEYLTVAELAKKLRYDVRTIRRRLARGLISGAEKSPGRNGHWRIPNRWRKP